MSMHDKDFQATTEYIKEVNNKLEQKMGGSTEHHYALRRSLLGCDYYHANPAKRIFCRIKMCTKGVNSFLCVSTAMVIIVGTSLVMVYDKKNHNVSIVPAVQVQEFNSEDFDAEYMQNLYTFGYLRFDKEEDDGCRVYKGTLEDEEVIVYDHQPYEIDLVVSN